MKKYIRKGDVLLIATLLFAACVSFALQNSGTAAKTAEIICDNETVLTVDFADTKEAYDTTLPNGMILSVCPDGISVVQSSCKDKLCVHCGKLTKNGDTAVCLPNRTLIKVSGEKQKDAPDIISY